MKINFLLREEIAISPFEGRGTQWEKLPISQLERFGGEYIALLSFTRLLNEIKLLAPGERKLIRSGGVVWMSTSRTSVFLIFMVNKWIISSESHAQLNYRFLKCKPLFRKGKKLSVFILKKEKNWETFLYPPPLPPPPPPHNTNTSF